MFGMRRREFITVLGGAAMAWPLAARAQQAAMPVIGFLSSRSPGESSNVVAAFRRGLNEAGFVEGQNTLIAFRWAEGAYNHLPALAADLIGLRVAVLVAAGGTPSLLTAKAATTTIPIVFTAVNDPVQLGFVPSFNRPGGNVTGISLFNNTLLAKRIGLLHEAVPTAAVIAMLRNPNSPVVDDDMKSVLATAQSLGLTVQVLNASNERDLDAAFEAMVRLHVGALVVQGEPFFDSRRDHIVELAAREGIPAIYAWREYAIAGGLISYGTSITDNYRQAGVYTGRILKGEKPAELPVVRPTKFEMLVNLKTAKALGLEISPSLIARADEVIE
jgi:putative ABC transport system substrate-binding protein